MAGVPVWIFLQIILVFWLGFPERTSRCDARSAAGRTLMSSYDKGRQRHTKRRPLAAFVAARTRRRATRLRQ